MAAFRATFKCPASDVESLNVAFVRFWTSRIRPVTRSVLDTASGSATRVRMGQALVLLSVLITSSTMGALHPGGATLRLLLYVNFLLLTLVVVTPLLPWARWSVRAPVIFPLSVLVGLAALGLNDDAAAEPYAGIIVFCFVYVGLTQRPGTSLLLTPPAAVTWLVIQGNWSATLVVRLFIAVIVWVTVGELLGQRTDREAGELRTLKGLALTDSLTGLTNRRGLDRRLSRVVSGDTVIMCDLDRFKVVNDRLGHQAGDRVLAQFGALLHAALRGEDLAARYGGEEFLLVLSATTPEGALDVVSRMRSRWAGQQEQVTFSTGIALVSDTVSVGQAIAAADEALYASKQSGRNCDHIAYQQIVRASL